MVELIQKKSALLIGCFILFLTLALPVFAQDEEVEESNDELIQLEEAERDTIEIDTGTQHSPGLASLYSAVLPGLGQAYNGKHWKIPIVYGTMFTFGYLIYDNNVKYQFFRRNLISELDDNPETINDTGRPADNLRANRDRFRRTRDLNMILFTVSYFLQIADAHIDAHLMEFNVNQNISVFVDPHVIQQNSRLSPGFSLKLKL